MAFKMRSGNKSSFKNIGSSPAKQLKGKQHKIDMNKDGKISKEDFNMMNNSPAKQRRMKVLDKRVGPGGTQVPAYKLTKAKRRKVTKQLADPNVKRRKVTKQLADPNKARVTKQLSDPNKGKRTMTKKMRKKTTKEKSADYDKRMVKKLKENYKTPAGAK